MNNSSFPEYHISLYFFNGPFAKKLRDFHNRYISIGSAQEKNLLTLSHHSIQPEHAYIVQDKGRVYIRTHHPTFYMAVNQSAVESAELHDGDHITLGNITCQIQLQIEARQTEVAQSGFTGYAGGYGSAQGLARTDPTQMQQQRGMPTNNINAMRPFSQRLHTSQQRNDVTRYLCAAVHTDEAFRDYVIEHILDEEIKAPGEAYGADIIPIARWALAARKRTLIRDIILVCSLFIGPIVLAAALRFLYMMLLTVNPQIAFLLYATGPLISYLLSLPLYIGLFILLFVLLIARPFPPEKNRRWLKMTLISFFLVPTSFTGITLLMPWLVMIVERLWCYYGPEAQLLTRNNFKAYIGGMALDPPMKERLEKRFPQKDGNFVVYSGYSPFAGSGLNINSWSFVVDISRGKEEFNAPEAANGLKKARATPTSFQVEELYTAQARALYNLGLKNLSIEDKLYANGKELRNQQAGYQKAFLPDPLVNPSSSVGSKIVEDFKKNPTEDIRYYQCVKVVSWKGDLILSVFLRFALVGKNPADENDTAKNLFIEGNYQLLPPIEEEYREIDYISTSWNLRRAWRLIQRTFIPTTFKRILGTPFRLLRALFSSWLLKTKQRQMREEITDNPSFDYGATTSLREVVSSALYQYHFQRLDKEMHAKLIEYQVFETIINFLEEHDIDTTQLRQRQQVIINSGTVVRGGTFNADNMTFGNSSNINMQDNSPDGGSQTTK